MFDGVRVGIKLALGVALFALVIVFANALPVVPDVVQAILHAIQLPINVMYHWVPGFSIIWPVVQFAIFFEFAALALYVGAYAYKFMSKIWT